MNVARCNVSFEIGLFNEVGTSASRENTRQCERPFERECCCGLASVVQETGLVIRGVIEHAIGALMV